MTPRVTPGQPVPDMNVSLVGGGDWNLADRKPDMFTLIEVYRGYHCPRCKVHLLSLGHKVARFKERGVDVIAVSTDDRERAEKTKAEWGLDLELGYGLGIDQAREWGLYVSEPIRDTEPNAFAEPGMFLVRPDGTLYSAIMGTTPFHRWNHADVLEAVDMIRARDYPPRGTG